MSDFPRKETWGILVRQDHELAAKETVTVEDIKQYPLIMPGRENAKKSDSPLDAV